MAFMSINGLTELMRDLDAAAADLAECSEEICTKSGEIIKEEQRKTGMSMGVYMTGETLGSLEVTPFAKSVSGGSVKIQFAGTNSDGNPNTEVAFINEFGKLNQPARPFIATANETSEAATIKVALDAVDRHLRKHNL